MVILAPIPSAIVSTATAVKPGFFSNWRKAKRKSFMNQRFWICDRKRNALVRSSLVRGLYQCHLIVRRQRKRIKARAIASRQPVAPPAFHRHAVHFTLISSRLLFEDKREHLQRVYILL